jgi:hypothetical protein
MISAAMHIASLILARNPIGIRNGVPNTHICYLKKKNTHICVAANVASR